MNISEKLQAADAAVQAAQGHDTATVIVALAAASLLTAAFLAPMFLPDRRTAALGMGAGIAGFFALGSVVATLSINSDADLDRALAQKASACEAAISELVDTGSPAVAKTAILHGCSRDDLLIAVLSSSNKLNADLAKALIRGDASNAPSHGS